MKIAYLTALLSDHVEIYSYTVVAGVNLISIDNLAYLTKVPVPNPSNISVTNVSQMRPDPILIKHNRLSIPDIVNEMLTLSFVNFV